MFTTSVLILIMVILVQSVSCSCNLQAGFTSADVEHLIFRVLTVLMVEHLIFRVLELKFILHNLNLADEEPSTAPVPPAAKAATDPPPSSSIPVGKGYSSASYQRAIDDEIKSFQREFDQFKASIF